MLGSRLQLLRDMVLCFQNGNWRIKMKEFLEKMVDLLDTESEITMDTKLNDIDEWDSLSIVSFIVMANANYGKKITTAMLKNAQTIRDLYDMVK